MGEVKYFQNYATISFMHMTLSYAYMYACMHAHTHTDTHTHMHTNIHTHTFAHMVLSQVVTQEFNFAAPMLFCIAQNFDEGNRFWRFWHFAARSSKFNPSNCLKPIQRLQV